MKLDRKLGALPARLVANSALLLVALHTPRIGLCEATTDGSVGTGTIQTLRGHFTIPQTLGTRSGPNLFHSFTRFNIRPNESATFTTSSNAIQSVITRVTGGEISSIEGLLRLNEAPGSKPEFFFINPAGVVFGADAQVDVPAGFHVSTAQQLNFADGFVWGTGSGAKSSLSIAAPEAFGFVGGTSPIKFNNFSLRAKTDLHIAGGLVELDSATLSVGDTGLLFLSGENVKLRNSTISSHNAQDHPPGRLAMTGGNIEVTSSSIKSTTSRNAPAADIDIQARSLLIEGGDQLGLVTSQIGSGESTTGHINIQLSGALSLRSSGFVLAGAETSGATSKINIRADSMSIDGGGFFAGVVSSQGVNVPGVAPGSIAITVNDLLRIENGGVISSGTQNAADAGAIDIRAKSILLDGKDAFARITSEAFESSSGAAGKISLRAADTISISRAADISASTGGAGAAGDIEISAHSVALDGAGVFARITSESTAGATGAAGVVTINEADDVLMRAGGTVSVHSEGAGNAGSIAINTGSLLIDRGAAFDNAFTGLDMGQRTFGQSGSAGSLSLTARTNVSLLTGGEISALNLGSGAGGSIDIQANSLTLDGGGILARISSQAFGSGDAGPITIKANDVLVTNQGKIFSSTFGTGAAGAIDIESNSLELRGPSFETGISALAAFGSSGQPGPVSILAREGVRITDQATLTIENHAVLDDPHSVQPATLTLSSPRIELASGARITAETSGNVAASKLLLTGGSPGGSLTITGDGTAAIGSNTRLPTTTEIGESLPLPAHGSAPAGNIEFVAGDLSIANVLLASQAKTGTTGLGGQMALRANGMLSLTQGTDISTDTAGAGNAGRVTLSAAQLRMEDAQISSGTLEGSSGDGGAIAIQAADSLTLSAGAEISASTNGEGRAGSIELDTAALSARGGSIRASAASESSGLTGNITIRAEHSVSLEEGATISIENNAVVLARAGISPSAADAAPRSTLSIAAADIGLTDASVSASATGNVAASSVSLDASNSLTLRNALLTTSAQDGDGGNIAVSAGALLAMERSAITTSVFGIVNGNAGDIQLIADRLLMKNGFVQANAAADQATGGNIALEVGALIVSGALLLGSGDALVFEPNLSGVNVVQAASPDGVAGTIEVSGPILDAGASVPELLPLTQETVLGSDLCRQGARSTFTRVSGGGLRLHADSWLRIENARAFVPIALARAAMLGSNGCR